MSDVVVWIDEDAVYVDGVRRPNPPGAVGFQIWPSRKAAYANIVARLRSEGWSEEAIQREVRGTFRRGKT